MKAKTRTNQPVEFEDYDLPDGTHVKGDFEVKGALSTLDDIHSDGDIITEGDFKAENGDVKALGVYADEIIENMEGYSYDMPTDEHLDISYAGVVKTGNKITFAIAGTYSKDADSGYNTALGRFRIPQEIANKLYLDNLGNLGITVVSFSYANSVFTDLPVSITNYAYGGTSLDLQIFNTGILTNGNDYSFRFEITFLLSENLISE